MTSVEVPASPPRPERIDGYLPIGGYGVIGNRRTAALVGADGAVDWWCLPGFEDPAACSRLLDAQGGGFLELAPAVPFGVMRRYLPDTSALETTFVCDQGRVRVTDAMTRPTEGSTKWNEIVRAVDGVEGEVPMRWRVAPRPNFGERRPRAQRRRGIALLGIDLDAMTVQSFGLGEPELGEDEIRGEAVVRPGDRAILAIGAFHDEPLLASRREEVERRLEQTLLFWREWSGECEYDGPWSGAVRRSALALQLLVDERSGTILAAATSGLPERIGGDRNYDYRYAWIRDANFTLDAMLALGYRRQVHTSFSWVLRATKATHPRLQPLYTAAGRARLDPSELDLPGYRGSRPVLVGNAATGQLQLGNFGDLLETANLYVEDGNSLDPGARLRMGESADFVARVWKNPDAGIWELPQDDHYTQSKIACWMALDRACRLAGAGEIDDSRVSAWKAAQDEIRAWVEQRCFSERLGGYARRAGAEDELDAAVLLAVRGGFLAPDDPRTAGTVDAIVRELAAGPGMVYRYTGMQEQEGAFIACTFWLVEALARLGRLDEAAEWMEAGIALANDVGLLSEEVDPGSRELLGNLPQALSHLALINAAVAFRDAQR